MELSNSPLATRYSLQRSERTLMQILDALLFASQKALTLKEIASYLKSAAQSSPEGPPAAFANVKEMELLVALQALRDDIAATHRSYELRETASGWQLVTSSAFAPWLRQLFPEAKPTRLSAPALETLAIIAYRQPITRADIEAVRGVAVDGVMQTILDRGLIRIEGRAEVPGRPLLYATTQFFLDHFGLRNLDELPNAAELRYIPLPKAEVPAEAAATVEGLSATAVAVEELRSCDAPIAAVEEVESIAVVEN